MDLSPQSDCSHCGLISLRYFARHQHYWLISSLISSCFPAPLYQAASIVRQSQRDPLNPTCGNPRHHHHCWFLYINCFYTIYFSVHSCIWCEVTNYTHLRWCCLITVGVMGMSSSMSFLIITTSRKSIQEQLSSLGASSSGPLKVKILLMVNHLQTVQAFGSKEIQLLCRFDHQCLISSVKGWAFRDSASLFMWASNWVLSEPFYLYNFKLVGECQKSLQYWKYSICVWWSL